MSDPSGTQLAVFAQDVRDTLMRGKRHQTDGFGTFSTCTRKATLDRPACTIAMFRPATELRAYASGGRVPPLSGPYEAAMRQIANALSTERSIDIAQLGHMALKPVSGKAPKLIFHAIQSLNDSLNQTKRTI